MQRPPLPSAAEIALLPADGGAGFNRLIFSSSPYLRQHARNPVDWHPWSADVFERARREDKPVFLSIGYSSCHWCHVMEHESFEDPGAARFLNERFIPVKVDREERPDLDEIYMQATQLMTGRGGWPNSVWLDAQRRPFFCGTYFPKEDRGNHPGFLTLLRELDDAWRTRPDAVAAQADRMEEALRALAEPRPPAAAARISRPFIRAALQQLEGRFDERNGGFGAAPKFPPHATLSLLLRVAADTPAVTAPLEMTLATLDAMALGGIHDHVGGGFHRYATDAEWFLPHFEKMLYDNAQLARVYALAFGITGREDYRRVAEDVCDWVLRDLRHPDGGFFSALDADSSGEEGLFYLWTHADLLRVLGPQDGCGFARLFQVTESGNHYDEATGERTAFSIPHLKAFPSGDDLALAQRCLPRLREFREKKEWPMIDDKVITAWNGLMISALAECGRGLGRPDYIDAAAQAADFILSRMRPDGRLRRTWRDGAQGATAFLDDHAFLLMGLVDLHQVTADKKWLAAAITLAAELTARFAAPEGAFHFAPSDHEPLLTRARDPYDNATPSPNGVAALALLRLSPLAGDPSLAEAGRKALAHFEPVIAQAPLAACTFLEAGWLLGEAPFLSGGLAAAHGFQGCDENGVCTPSPRPGKKDILVDDGQQNC